MILSSIGPLYASPKHHTCLSQVLAFIQRQCNRWRSTLCWSLGGAIVWGISHCYLDLRILWKGLLDNQVVKSWCWWYCRAKILSVCVVIARRVLTQLMIHLITTSIQREMRERDLVCHLGRAHNPRGFLYHFDPTTGYSHGSLSATGRPVYSRCQASSCSGQPGHFRLFRVCVPFIL